MKKLHLAVALAVLALAGGEPSFAQFTLHSATLAGGGGVTQSIGTRMTATIGLSFSGVASDDNSAAAAGFLYATRESITVTSTEVEQIGEDIPDHYELHQNYPNPFNPTTTIKYGLPEAANVRISVFNVLGQLVTLIVDKEQAAGYYEITWDATNEAGVTLPSGLYFYRVDTKNFSTTRSMVFQK